MAKTMLVTVPEGFSAGDTFEVEIPVMEKKPRGQLAGIALAEMTDEQLKRESINANSVLYKAKQRGASEETIAANQARVDAVNALKAERGIGVKAAAPVADASNLEEALGESDAATAEEI